MKILAIETSCDETSASVVLDGSRILSNVVSSSLNLHKKTYGIVPEVAARKQVESIIPALDEALKRSKTSLSDIDAIAVTIGPGLIGSLIVGVTASKMLGLMLGKKIIPVNHLLAHIYANWALGDAPQFPLVALIVSGGHTELVLMESHTDIKYLGGTRDDAAGECFDKVARILSLGYPGGPAIQKEAEKFGRRKSSLVFPKPLLSKGYEFSFSGLKTAVFETVRNGEGKYDRTEIAFAFQETVCDILTKKATRAATDFGVKSLLVSGGVAANKNLRDRICKAAGPLGVEAFIPPINLCTDNAVPIGICAFYHQNYTGIEDVFPKEGLSLSRESP